MTIGSTAPAYAQSSHAADHVGWESCAICQARRRSTGSDDSSSAGGGAGLSQAQRLQQSQQDFARFQDQQRAIQERAIRPSQERAAMSVRTAQGIASMFMNLGAQEDEDDDEPVRSRSYTPPPSSYTPPPSSYTVRPSSDAETRWPSPSPSIPAPAPFPPPEPAKPLLPFSLASVGDTNTGDYQGMLNDQVLHDLGRGGSPTLSDSPAWTSIGSYRLKDYSALQRFGAGESEPPLPPPGPSLLDMVFGPDTAQNLRERWGDAKDRVATRLNQATSFGAEVGRQTTGALADQLLGELRSGEHSGSWRELASEALVTTTRDAAQGIAREALESKYRAMTFEERNRLQMRETAGGFLTAPVTRDRAMAEDGMQRTFDEYSRLGDSLLAPQK